MRKHTILPTASPKIVDNFHTHTHTHIHTHIHTHTPKFSTKTLETGRNWKQALKKHFGFMHITQSLITF